MCVCVVKKKKRKRTKHETITTYNMYVYEEVWWIDNNDY